MGLGNAGGEWTTPSVPDTPLDCYQDAQNFWQNIIGAGQISAANDTDLLVPRKTWTSGNSYVVPDETNEVGSGTLDNANGRNFYVCNTEASPKVYKLLTAGGGTSTEEPTHTTPEGATPAPATESDGYQWAYLYTIGVGGDVPNSMLTQSWMPVPSSAAAYTNGDATVTQGVLRQGDDSDGTYGQYPASKIFQCLTAGATTSGASLAEDSANTWVEWQADHTLGAYYVGCTLAFPDSAGTGGIIANVEYRQVAILRNPKNSSGDRLTAQWVGSAWESYLTLTRDVVMTIDNRTTVTRTAGQTETVRTILEF